jgi:hypothetical protein
MADILRDATMADLDDMTEIMCSAMPMTPAWNYRFPRRQEFPRIIGDVPAKIWKGSWTRALALIGASKLSRLLLLTEKEKGQWHLLFGSFHFLVTPKYHQIVCSILSSTPILYSECSQMNAPPDEMQIWRT